MSYFLHDVLGDLEDLEITESATKPARGSGTARSEEMHIFGEKLRTPTLENAISRPRLYELLDRSETQFPATLISGRAGTGKTTLAADFAARRKNAAWYSVDSSDADWSVFARYFSASLFGQDRKKRSKAAGAHDDIRLSQSGIAQYLVACFSQIETNSKKESLLIVLDDIHRIFDAEWFCDFFNLLLFSLPPNTHLLMLCRSKPPNPLWRLRSKQMLNVIEEKLLAFNLAEAEELCRVHGLSEKLARKVHSETFGRVSKMMRFFQ